MHLSGKHAKSLQLCSPLCSAMDCSLPGSSVHGILQARILEWVAAPSSRGSSRPWDRTCISYVSCTGRWVLYHQHHLGSPRSTLNAHCVLHEIFTTLYYKTLRHGGEINLCGSQFYSFGENTLKYIHSKYVGSLTTSVSFFIYFLFFIFF